MLKEVRIVRGSDQSQGGDGIQPTRSEDSGGGVSLLRGQLLTELDSSAWSPLHRWHALLASAIGSTFSTIVITVGIVLLTFGSMFTAAGLEGVWSRAANPLLRVPFLQDWSLLFVILISLPLLVVFLVTDETVLRESLCHVLRDGVLTIPEDRAHGLLSKWKTHFRWVNLICQVGAMLIAVVCAWLTLRANASISSGSWVGAGGTWSKVTYLSSLFVLYVVILFFAVRCVSGGLFLNSIVQMGRVFMQPFHPDRCGGMRPIGQLGLRNQYVVTILGLNVVVLAAEILRVQAHDAAHLAIVLAGALVYLTLGPIVFLGPLLPFHGQMRRSKEDALLIVVQRLKAEYERVAAQIREGAVTAGDIAVIERVRQWGKSVEELPVWPFDTRTLVRFASAYVIPIGAAILEHESLLEEIGKLL